MNVPLFEIYNDEEDIKLISEEIASGKFWAVGSRVSEFEEKIAEYIEKAQALLDIGKERLDGEYAFACEKCATVFGYYGYFYYENELKERSRRIYEGA